MNKDTLTTIVGGIGSAAMAAQPVLNGVSGSLHQADYFQLFAAMMFSVLSFFTNKNGVK